MKVFLPQNLGFDLFVKSSYTEITSSFNSVFLRFSVCPVPGFLIGPILPGGKLFTGAGDQLWWTTVGGDLCPQSGGGGEGVSGEGSRGEEREGRGQTESLSRQRRR